MFLQGITAPNNTDNAPEEVKLAIEAATKRKRYKMFCVPMFVYCAPPGKCLIDLSNTVLFPDTLFVYELDAFGCGYNISEAEYTSIEFKRGELSDLNILQPYTSVVTAIGKRAKNPTIIQAPFTPKKQLKFLCHVLKK